MKNSIFGYPVLCTNCRDEHIKGLNVDAYYKPGNDFRLMLIGQDPTIRKGQDRVKVALMLDDESSQISRWLSSMFTKDRFNSMTIYATNVVKCTFKKPPTEIENGSKKILIKCFERCKDYLKNEISLYQPSLIITLGESAHLLFRSILDNPDSIPHNMKEAFTGQPRPVSISGNAYEYSPCLHIQTFRVASTYGDRVQKFISTLSDC